ncbi:MAG: T9SS type A sorting domain-containing protein [Bacteroidetes bacterium]|nr:T9SS type A sorting domain-containing protein [Bacteroidota bacterium]
MKKIKILLLLTIISFLSHAEIINGFVYDNLGKTVSGALVQFTNESDQSKIYQTYSDAQGKYEIDIPVLLNSEYQRLQLYKPFPSPFCQSTTISFFNPEETQITISIYNISGQKITQLHNEVTQAGFHQLTWNDALQIAPGVYFIFLTSATERQVQKIIKMKDCPNIGLGGSWPYDFFSDSNLINYEVKISGNAFETLTTSDLSFGNQSTKDFYVYRSHKIPFACNSNYLGIWNGQSYSDFFIKGINLGVSKPGTHPGELAADRDDYQRWLVRIAEIGFNVIRTYTLHYPRFYEELANYNIEHPENPIYLIQGVWLEEENPSADLYDLTASFDQEIEENVDCIHGNRTIGHRFGKAYGEYKSDVSRWTLAYIIGREIHTHEVAISNANNSAISSFSGGAFSIALASPSEVWITARLNHLVVYERTNYQTERPISMSSWPTQDPLDHPTETHTSEDSTEYDMHKINSDKAVAGYFASYHAYPYYPDFISMQSSYQSYFDSNGMNSYKGYLDDLRKHYTGRPLIIGEFGVPSSWGNAHFCSTGMDHGGHDELTQGKYNIRLLNTIDQTNCGGAILFAWIDEWFKVTWIVDTIGTAQERRPLWHNVTSPEQNFGMIAFEPKTINYTELTLDNTNCNIKSMKVADDDQFFHVQIELKSVIEALDTLWIALDTYRDDLGESILPNGVKIKNRSEFLLRITPGDSANLYSTQAYDLFEYWHGNADPKQLFHSIATDGDPWHIIRWRNNIFDTSIFYIGQLRSRHENEQASSKDAVVWSGKNINIRIPWTLLLFTDPSKMEVLDDDRSSWERETVKSDGISLNFVQNNCITSSDRYSWLGWNQARPYSEREKPWISDYNKALEKLNEFR